MFDHLFRAHPRSVGESYWQHFRVAASFGLTMIGGGMGALVHAVVPALYQTKGSETITALHRRLVQARNAKRDARTIEWMI